jgi:hypothetical protein
MHTEFVSEKAKEVKPLVGQSHSLFIFVTKRNGGGRTKYFYVFNMYMHVFNENYFSTNINTYVYL